MRIPVLGILLVATWSGAPATAQLPSLDVTDLVGSEQVRPLRGETFVARVLQGHSLREHGAWTHRLDVVSAHQLLPGWEDAIRPEQPAASPDRILDPKTLCEIVGRLIEVDPRDLVVHRIGRRWFLRGGLAERLEQGLARVRAALPGPVALDVRLTRRSAADEVVLVDGQARSAAGATRLFGATSSEELVYDLDCEVAGGVWIHVPRTTTRTSGAQVALRARAVPFTDLVALDVLARDARPLDAEPVPFQAAAGPLQRIDQEFGEVATACVVRRGDSAVLEWESGAGTVWELAVDVGGERGEAVGQGVLLAASGLLADSVVSFRSTMRGVDDSPEAEGWIPSLLGRCMETARRRQPGLFFDPPHPFDAAGGNRFAVLEDSPAGRRLTAELGQRFAELLAPVELEVELLDVPVGYRSGETSSGEAPRLAAFRGRLLLDRDATFSAVRERTFVFDVDAEIAGGGARVLDPQIGVLETGWVANVAVLGPLGDQPPQLDLELSVTGLDRLLAREVTLSSDAVQQGGTRRVPPAKLEADVVRIESPCVPRFHLDRVFDLAVDGRFEAIYRASSLLGTDRRLLLRGRVVTPGKG